MAQGGWNIISAHNCINIQGVPLTKKWSARFNGHGFTPMCWREQTLLAITIIIITFFAPQDLRYISTHLSTSWSSHLGSWGSQQKGKRWNQQKFLHGLFVIGSILCEKTLLLENTTWVFPEHFPLFSNDTTLLYLGELLTLASCILFFLAGNLHGWVGKECYLLPQVVCNEPYLSHGRNLLENPYWKLIYLKRALYLTAHQLPGKWWGGGCWISGGIWLI